MRGEEDSIGESDRWVNTRLRSIGRYQWSMSHSPSLRVGCCIAFEEDEDEEKEELSGWLKSSDGLACALCPCSPVESDFMLVAESDAGGGSVMLNESEQDQRYSRPAWKRK